MCQPLMRRLSVLRGVSEFGGGEGSSEGRSGVLHGENAASSAYACDCGSGGSRAGVSAIGRMGGSLCKDSAEVALTQACNIGGDT